MTILLSFTVLDVATDTFAPPFFCKHQGEAVRSFMDACNDKSIPFGKYPDEFVLFSNGSYDDASGLFEGHTPRRVLSAREALGRMSTS